MTTYRLKHETVTAASEDDHHAYDPWGTGCLGRSEHRT